jgi:hypothetical protein
VTEPGLLVALPPQAEDLVQLVDPVLYGVLDGSCPVFILISKVFGSGSGSAFCHLRQRILYSLLIRFFMACSMVPEVSFHVKNSIFCDSNV